MVFAVGLTAAAAQNPTTPPPPRNPASPDPAYARTQARFVTVEGCVMREAGVPGREPNVERAGIDEDYILTSTKMIKGAAPAPAAEARPADTPTGTSGTGAMYEIKGIDDEQLKQHVGHRVQIEGTFENIERAQTSPGKKAPADHLAEIRGTSIRQVAGECPAK
jgi:hypothetical protein